MFLKARNTLADSKTPTMVNQQQITFDNLRRLIGAPSRPPNQTDDDIFTQLR